MELIDAVNLILPKLGEHPVTTLDSKHPTLAVIIPQIELELDNIVQPGWWFNTTRTTLYPDLNGDIYIPTDTLDFLADDRVTAIRGTQLMDMTNDTPKFSAPVKGERTLRLSFNMLPESAAKAVLYKACVSAYVTDIGMGQDVQAWQRDFNSAYAIMEAEHLRQRRYSTKYSRRFQNIRRAMRG